MSLQKYHVVINNKSYQVEQKIGKHIYIYEATGYWDPEKKQIRQKRTYIEKKDPVTGEIIPARKAAKPRISRDFGNIWLLKQMAQSHGLMDYLERVFGDEAEDLFHLAAFQMCEGKPFYLFKPGERGQPLITRVSRLLRRLAGSLKIWEREIINEVSF